MRFKTSDMLEKCRINIPGNAAWRGKPVGAFVVPAILRETETTSYLKIVAHDGNEADYVADRISGPRFEHVSVSVLHENRCPTWEEMKLVKELFWTPDETVVQFHPAESEYVNDHPYTLHLWREVGKSYQLPDKQLV